MTDTLSPRKARADWRQNLAKMGEETGFFRALGHEHSALFVEGGDTLIVTFENLDHVYERTEDRLPWGYGFVTKRGWSMLGLMAHDWTWYRDEAVYDFFDELRDTGFFNRFKKVVFYGASMGAYAAAAFSAAAPGATVILISPQATLDREKASWEYRYLKAWRRNFKDRYGYAPDYVTAAENAYVFYDPRMAQDAMHATLFDSPNITKFPCRFLGHRMASLWVQMGILTPIIEGCVAGTLSRQDFYKMMRARHQSTRYQRELLDAVLEKNRPRLTVRLCEYVLSKRGGPKFRTALKEAQKQLPSPKRIRVVKGMNFDAFDAQDHLNIILQRSEILHDVKSAGRKVKAWTQGDATALEEVVREKNIQLPARAYGQINDEFTELLRYLNGFRPNRLADIGCGYGFFSFAAAKHFECDVELIDIETSENRHFGFEEVGAAYSNLQKAARFLSDNGISEQKIRTTNPMKDDLNAIQPVDMIVSLLACGFHFPIDGYMPFFEEKLVDGGRLIMDLRNSQASDQIKQLSALGTVDILSKQNNRQRIMLTRRV